LLILGIIESKYSIATVISYSSLVIMALLMDSLDRPSGVAYDHNNNRIIVADTDNYRIQVFSFAKYSLTLYEGSNPSDGVINLGEDITAKATTTNNDIINVKFRWIDPSNNEARTNTVNIVNGEASDAYTPNQVGTWKVVAEFSNGTIVVKELQVPFQVVGIGREETLEFNDTDRVH
jgi:hypothetical protein